MAKYVNREAHRVRVEVPRPDGLPGFTQRGVRPGEVVDLPEDARPEGTLLVKAEKSDIEAYDAVLAAESLPNDDQPSYQREVEIEHAEQEAEIRRQRVAVPLNDEPETNISESKTPGDTGVDNVSSAEIERRQAEAQAKTDAAVSERRERRGIAPSKAPPKASSKKDKE